MSDEVETIIGEVGQAAQAATPILGTVNVVAKLADDVLALVTPGILQSEADAPSTEYTKRLQQYETIIDNPNEATRAQQLGDFVSRVCLDAGVSAGFLSGQQISVPVEYFNDLVEIAGQLIKIREQISATANAAKTTTQPNGQPTVEEKVS